MQGLEDLLNGMPQQISDGAILLALSAWHLYPDLIVLRNKIQKVNFADALIPPTSVITVGLECIDPSLEGIQWSLTLSHLRYYGGPIRIDVQEDNSRVTMEQLCIVVLGAFLASWDVTPKDMRSVANWIHTVWTYMATGCDPARIAIAHPWLSVLASAASRVINSSETELEICQMLLKFGSRRRSSIFGLLEPSHAFWERNIPFFGLCNPFILHALEAGSPVECGVRYLRSVAQQLEIGESEAVIVYTERTEGLAYIVFATALAHHSRASSASGSGNIEEEGETWRHARWVHAINCGRAAGNSATQIDHLRNSVTGQLGEEFRLLEGDENDNFASHRLNWHTAPRLYTETRPCFSADLGSGCSCLEQDSERREVPKFIRFLGHEFSICLFVVLEPKLRKIRDLHEMHKDILQCTIDPEQTMRQIQRKIIPSHNLWRYIGALSAADSERIFELEKIPSIMRVISLPRIPDHIIKTLQAFDIASRIYEQFPSATIPLKITSSPIISATWLPPLPSTWQPSFMNVGHNITPLQLMTRPQVFSCLAMFESGGINVNPAQLKGVMAMSAGNSIFVAEILLSDPAINLPAYAIKRVVGNIGSPGISLLVVPPNQLRIRPINNDFMSVMHADFDYKRQNNFENTSLHLSFTGWKVPYMSGSVGLIGQDVHFVEAVVAVRDRGVWVADIDVLGSLPKMAGGEVSKSICSCPIPLSRMESEVISIDTWDELLDPPQTAAIVRSHDNWVGRLSTACVAQQMFPNHLIVVLNKEMECWKCFGTNQLVRRVDRPHILID
jgi:hypothetical protein